MPTADEIIVLLEDDDQPFEHATKQALAHILRNQEKLMTQQDDINAAITALQNDETGLDASVQAILAEISTLQGQGVDTSGLTAAVADLQGHVDAVAAIAPAAPPAG